MLINLLHDSDSSSHHGPIKVLDNVKAVKDNLGIWKELLDNWDVSSGHIASDDLDCLPRLSRVLVEIVFDRRLAIIFQDCDDFSSLIILSNEGEFPFVSCEFIPR